MMNNCLHGDIYRLIHYIKGRQNEKIVISKAMARQMYKMNYEDYVILQHDLESRKIVLEVGNE